MANAACGIDEIRNFFTRAQHTLDTQFGLLEGPIGMWDGKIRDLGAFPNASGWATRSTVLGFQRPRHTSIRFNPMVGLQDDCTASCDVQANEVRLGNADHLWTRMTEYAENTEPFCLIKMLGDALELGQQIRQHIKILRDRTADIMDEFKRANYSVLARNKWAAVDGINSPRRNLWRFATDANGQPDVNYIILEPGVDAADLSLPTIPILNYIVTTGSYNGAFPRTGGGTIITDWETIQELPKFDTNVRADNRYRDPSALNPALPGDTARYAGYQFEQDLFGLRYAWTLDDPSYPLGVLKRIEPWTSKQVSEGCWDEVSTDYLEADFAISPFYNPDVMGLQHANITAPAGMPFEQPQSPYNGMWTFKNEVNEVTPCNQDRTKAYWRMVFRMAAKPINNGELGHVFLHRRFNTRGPVKSCRPLVVPVGGSVDCSMDCAPFDWQPAPLVDRVVCPGLYNADGGACTVE